MKKSIIIISSFIFLTPLPSIAQTEISFKENISGTINKSSNGSDALRYDCYLLETEVGDHVYVGLSSRSFNTLLRVGRGFDCETATWDLSNDDYGWLTTDSSVNFGSGGGPYLIMVSSSSGTAHGAYSLIAHRAGRMRSGLLAPGERVFAAPPGTASTATGPLPQERAGQTLKDCITCPEIVVIRPGSFMMGSPATEEGREGSEGPRHLVTIPRAFALGKYEVTFEEYDACVADKGCRQVADNGWGRGRRPVVNVSFLDALRYVGWLSKTTGQAYHLPSEAEWEYAARAGTDTPWNTGSAIVADDANILDQFKKTVTVGGYPANAWGLHDTHGNVSEWVQDCMDTGYVGVPTDGGAALSGDCKERRVLRDGSFSEAPASVRSAHRLAVPSRTSNTARGFRVARAL